MRNSIISTLEKFKHIGKYELLVQHRKFLFSNFQTMSETEKGKDAPAVSNVHLKKIKITLENFDDQSKKHPILTR